MNKFKFYFILIITSITIFSCSKNDDSATVEPPRDYADQYKTDIEDIEEYLKTNYITVTNAPGQTSDQDVVISKITDATTQPSIMSYLDAPTYPMLKTRIVELHNIKYTLYYLILREGIGQSPCNVDEVYSSYRGTYLQRTTTTTPPTSTINATEFTNVIYPNEYLSLFTTVRGWKEIFPKFKTGTYVSNPNGTISYNDFGAGVMFIPSGLGYYIGSGSIPAYAPLVFSFKLYELQRSDDEGTGYRGTSSYIATPDGVFSYQEDLDGDGYVWTTSELPTGATNPDDTDKDGIPDFLDVDDDADNYTTRLEIKNPVTGLPFPFADIPTCTSGKKNYLDASCH